MAGRKPKAVEGKPPKATIEETAKKPKKAPDSAPAPAATTATKKKQPAPPAAPVVKAAKKKAKAKPAPKPTAKPVPKTKKKEATATPAAKKPVRPRANPDAPKRTQTNVIDLPKGKAGRPRIFKAEGRNKQIRVYLTPADYKWLHKNYKDERPTEMVEKLIKDRQGLEDRVLDKLAEYVGQHRGKVAAAFSQMLERYRNSDVDMAAK